MFLSSKHSPLKPQIPLYSWFSIMANIINVSNFDWIKDKVHPNVKQGIAQ